MLNALAYPGKILTQTAADQISSLLDHVESDQRWGVSAGVPDTASVELKNGWLSDTDGWDINSIGHIHGGDVDYTIAVLTNGNATEQYGIDTIEQLAAATWNVLGQ